MKIFPLFLLTLLCIATACGEDDEATPGNSDLNNALRFRGEVRPLGVGELEDIGADDESYDWDIDLYYAGSEDYALTLDLNVEPGAELQAGTYQMALERRPFVLVPSLFDWYPDGATAPEEWTLEGGSATVELDGEVTIVNFDLTTDDGERVTGNWRGVLEE